ncbi:hypothetical protein [Massilia sp. DD77]|uniref:hypothetical protein n=1 Tax=Massilia sp. DD77 TaxID=3109349 RepID=UPI002FFE14FD
MSVKGDLIAVGIAGVVLLAAAWFAKRKLGEAATAVAPYVNPADGRNVINQGATAIYQGITGSKGSIGGDLYDLWNPPRENVALDLLPLGAPYAVDFYQYLTNSDGNQIADYQDGVLFRGAFNPASDNNLIYRGVNNVGEYFTGKEGWTLGGAIYDWTH